MRCADCDPYDKCKTGKSGTPSGQAEFALLSAEMWGFWSNLENKFLCVDEHKSNVEALYATDVVSGFGKIIKVRVESI